jgi:beta-lactam-binding protein with PASTA domain
VEPPEEPAASTFELADLVGQVFAERYRVLRLVSEGASMALYDVVDTAGRAVSLKLVRPRLAASPSFRAKFDVQVRAVAALSHPNIAAVYDWGVAPIGDVSTAYVVAEQLTGGSLRDMFDRGRRLSPSQALSVGLDACRGLDHAHRRGFVHTELTPSKLVFGDDRRLRIVDFGLARLLGERAWANPEDVSNHVAWYAAPEQAQGAMVDGSVDGKADVYALCLCLHEAVTGAPPFKSDSSVATLASRVGRLMPVSADLGPLASVLERAGRPDPAERSSAAEFGKALVAAASKLPRPEPLPLFATGLFDVPPEDLRAPDDPTGGVRRRANPNAPTEVLVVPVDEPGPAEPDPPVPAVAPVAAAPGTGAASPAPVIVPSEPAVPATTGVAPTHGSGDLVILPLDTGIEPHPGTGSRRTAPTDAIPVIDQRAPRRRRRFPWKIVLGLFVIATLVALGVAAARYFARTPTHVVPPLVGLSEAEARNLIAPNDWVVSEQSERSDAVPEEGAIVRTAPDAGAELAEGEPFLLVVSEGPTLRPLPDVTGVPLAEALATLDELGLVGEPVDEFHELVPDGSIVSWEVPGEPSLVAGTPVLPDTVVRLVVSDGPRPRSVPDLHGVDVNGARVAVESEQLVFRVEAEQQFSDEFAAGTVMWQNIDPGAEVPRGSEIVVVVSKGPDVVPFPDLSQAPTYNDAAALLVAAGFDPTLTFGDAEGAVQEVQIGDVTPTPGDLYPRGTTVFIKALTLD